MKFLIVNNFKGKTNENIFDFSTFVNLIKRKVKKMTKSTDTDTEFFTVKTMAQLENFLVDPQVNYVSEESSRKFDLIDVVLINGRVNPVPWSRANKQVICFFQKYFLKFFLIFFC